MLVFSCFVFSLLWLLSRCVVRGAVTGYITYANSFFDPTSIVGGKFNTSTLAAQATIISWADELAAQGPWAVTNKTFTPTGADPHDYVSFAPYWWPDCSNAGNETELTQEEVWAQCNYHHRDGQFNPDFRNPSLNNSGDFNALADAVMYNSLAWILTSDDKHAANTVRFIKIWFLDEDTRMKPNLNYAQMRRGPDGQQGSHVGVLDLRAMSKILSGILILRQANSSHWTSQLDTRLREWSQEYIEWLTTSRMGIGEREALNNHGSYYFNQLAAFQILVDDIDGAKETLEDYFNGIFQGQIDSDGEQPLEAERTLPYHYRSYNALAACINARLGQFVGIPDPWSRKTREGGTLQAAFDYIIEHTTPPPTAEDPSPLDLFPALAMFASGNSFGDPTGKYMRYLRDRWDGGWKGDEEFDVVWQPWIFWEQPLGDVADGGVDQVKESELEEHGVAVSWRPAEATTVDTAGNSQATSEAPESQTNAATSSSNFTFMGVAYVLFVVLFTSFGGRGFA